jgi:hypothetical protein|tara:strand:+ start:1646 stop:2068 length:423 start_codon:yes stop_codon:yes gene_type:complete
MIKYNLKCVNKHEFESWFSESKEFDRLKKKKLIECIFCHTKNVEKSIMSPRILNSRDLKNQNEIPNIKMKNFKNDLQNLRKFVEKNFEFVEKNFAKKIREVYYDKKSEKNIYGSTTEEEKEELREEGIELLSIPWIDKDN